MRFEGSLTTGDLNFVSMETQDPNLSAMKSYRLDRTRYIHRCPFSHCPHQEMLGPQVETDPIGIKVSLDKLEASTFYSPHWQTLKQANELRQGHYVARGAGKPKVTSQYRHRAILYMLSRMKVKDVNEKIQARLMASILTLEKQVYEDSDSKEKYMENLATKLFLIFQELDKRVKSGKATSIYAQGSGPPRSLVQE